MRFKYKLGSTDSESVSGEIYGNEIDFTLGILIAGSILVGYFFNFTKISSIDANRKIN